MMGEVRNSNLGESLEIPDVSTEGLEAIIEWGGTTIIKLAELQTEFGRARHGDDGASAMVISERMAQMSGELDLAVSILDQILPQAGTSWRTKMEAKNQVAKDDGEGRG